MDRTHKGSRHESRLGARSLGGLRLSEVIARPLAWHFGIDVASPGPALAGPLVPDTVGHGPPELAGDPVIRPQKLRAAHLIGVQRLAIERNVQNTLQARAHLAIVFVAVCCMV